MNPKTASSGTTNREEARQPIASSSEITTSEKPNWNAARGGGGEESRRPAVPILRHLRACADVPLEVFYAHSTAKALRICNRCPVRMACLDEATAYEMEGGSYRIYGVRGGMTAEQRKRYVRLRRELAS